MHLVTHAFFKSLLFMCSGSVIHAVHTNDMRKMGGLFRKMPVTAITMLIGCLAIAGVAVPFVIGFSGYYSKDAILEQSLSFWSANGASTNPWAGLFFMLAAFGAALTTCYMFRMWFLTFVGQPRDKHAYEHAHESPPVMTLPLVVLAVMAVSVAWSFELAGYFLIAAAFFVARGMQQGWFQHIRSASHGHGEHGHGHEGHGDHGHGSHGHGQDGHGAHGHEAHGHSHAAHDHGHAGADHGHHAAPSEPPITWGWLGTMLACTLVGGALLQMALHRALPAETLGRLNGLTLAGLLEQARPAGTLAGAAGNWIDWTWPNEHDSHVEAIRVPATLLATGSWLGGFVLAAAFYWWGVLSADDVRRQFAPVYHLLVNKWWFDELYDFVFVRPTLLVSRVIAALDRRWIDGFLDGLAQCVIWFSRRWDFIADRSIVDGLVNLMAGWTYSIGLSLRAVQTGRLRQYVMFIVIGAIAIFALVSFFWSPTLAK
jgi:NADH-quinone oxidoreductase subunit L